VATRKKTWILYGAGLFAGYLLFCFYLKWQLFMGRLELPLFALAAPIAGAFLETIRPAIVPMVVCAFLLVNTRLPLFQNWTRPLTGPHSLFAPRATTITSATWRSGTTAHRIYRRSI
jgi:hypothetical protein